MHIRKLDPRTSEQIAAGEIVENPSSVVKELVENSLDAGAKRIKVFFKRGGLKEITVIDDGAGIPREEIRLALERHATSKISSLEDLQKIRTLGFRGEALPSIASVSRMSITSRHQNEATGRYIFLEGGKEKEYREVGFPVGTRVTIEDLFYNTPARLKFLKGVPSETARFSKIIHLLALSRPDISFSLIKENDVLMETPGDGNLLNVILKVFGNELTRELVSLNFKSGELNLRGYVSNPSFSRNSRNYQILYINGRYVRSQLVKSALDRSFASIITSKRYPAAFLYLSLPPENLDINIHPSKIEVRFHQEELLRTFLEQSLKKAFSPGYFVSRLQDKDLQNENNSLLLREKQEFKKDLFIKETTKYNHYPESDLKREVNEKHFAWEDEKSRTKSGSYLRTELFTERLFNGPISGQVFATYIIIQEGDKLIFVDQHAAHERILWEKIRQKEREKEIHAQVILPLPLELPLLVAEAIRDKMDLLKDIGLEMEQFGNNTFIIRTVPFFLKDIFTTEMLMDILEELSTLSLTDKEFQKETLLRLSCKAAIKANNNLSIEEIKSLLTQLEKCENPFFCPHGRPVMIKIEKNELEKHFKRRG
ncbi:MAG: DNA mismatch repair endonuclease MutL [Dethiobacter sp.]|jgi:DNA mismatch repair protein MutL|nr:MAG: DNA mismatch repair endonuclease MutL [Dethiobacter sp.]